MQWSPALPMGTALERVGSWMQGVAGETGGGEG